GDAELARQVIVAAPRMAQRFRLAAQRLARNRDRRSKAGELLEQAGNLGAREAIVAMAALALAAEQTAVEQLGEMPARRLRGHSGSPGKLPGGQGASVRQRHQHRGARWIGDEGGSGRDIGQCAYTSISTETSRRRLFYAAAPAMQVGAHG